MARSFSSNILTSYRSEIESLTRAHQDAHARLNKNRTQVKAVLWDLTRASQKETGRTEKLRSGGKSLAEKTTAQFCLSILRTVKRPLTTDEVMERAVKGGWVSTGRSPYSSIYQTLRGLSKQRPIKLTKNNDGTWSYGAKAHRLVGARRSAA